MNNHDFGTMLVNDIIKRINVKNKKDFNYNNIVKLIFEYAKFVHGITDADNIELSFKDLGEDNIGGDFSVEDKTITINSNNFTFKNLGIVIKKLNTQFKKNIYQSILIVAKLQLCRLSEYTLHCKTWRYTDLMLLPMQFTTLQNQNMMQEIMQTKKLKAY